jgi:branched-subunit amino acid aminotransferase/4-amino-4-deoxychorismate lyase
MPESVAYLNGRWLPQSRAGLSLHDAGFVMGVTVADFARTFHRRLADWDAHLSRFQASVAAVDLGPWEHSDATITPIAEELVRRNSATLGAGGELVLVLFATPGPIGHYLGESASGPPTFGMHTFPLPFERYRGMIERGVHLRVSEIEDVSPRTIPPAIKHRSRLHWHLADRAAARIDGGTSRPLLLDAAGRVTETSFANLVVVRGGVVLSPRRETILPGIGLRIVEELCGKLGLPFEERDLYSDDCLAADEVLLCGTAFCLARVSRLDDAPMPPAGPIFQRLLEAWNARVGLDIHGQFLA